MKVHKCSGALCLCYVVREYAVFNCCMGMTHQSIILYPTEIALSNHHATIYNGDQ